MDTRSFQNCYSTGLEHLKVDGNAPARPMCVHCKAQMDDPEDVFTLTCDGDPMNTVLRKPGGDKVELVQDILIHINCKNNFIEVLATQLDPEDFMKVSEHVYQSRIAASVKIPPEYLYTKLVKLGP